MTVDECMEYTKKVKDFDIRMLALRIGESYEKHERNEKLTKLDKFLLGLRYSEFLATADTDEGYVRAERKRQVCLNKLGLSVEQINALVLNLCNLH